MFNTCAIHLLNSSFSGSGSVYVWGGGYDGQLGLGNTVTFQSSPKKLRHSKLKNNVVQIEAGESYSAALTGKAPEMSNVVGQVGAGCMVGCFMFKN